jgi:hypothetical protein
MYALAMMLAPPGPTITEVLYIVPQKLAGDASQDGSRHATGDEFVELANTGDKPVDLKGWALVDSDSWWFLTDNGKKPLDLKSKPDGKDFLFVFPACTLKPGEVAVVFNGLEQKPVGPTGTGEAAAGKNDKFAGALVFTMKAATGKVGFGNDGDWVALVSPEGKFVEVVKWGKPDHDPPKDAGAVAEAPADPKGSAQREAAGGRFVDHAALGDKSRLFSPGEFKPTPAAKGPQKPADKPPPPAEPDPAAPKR